MFNKSTSGVVTDLLFNLLLTFVCLFFLAFVLVNDPKEEEKGVEHDALYMITLTWQEDCDLDLWIKLPDGNKVFYAKRESGPVFLDVDVVTWKRFHDSNGQMVYITPNQEISTIRGGALEGEHVISVHYFGGGVRDVEATIVIHDIKKRNVVYTGTKTFEFGGQEQYFATMTLEKASTGFKATYTDSVPEYIVGGQ